MAGGQRRSKQSSGAALQKADKIVRDDLIYLTRLSGAKLKEIQAAFNLSKPTVQKAIQSARHGRIGSIARDLVLTRLLPQAIATLEAEMELGGERAVDVALNLVNQMQILTPLTPEGTHVVEEFEAFRRKIVTTSSQAPPVVETFDAEVVPQRDGHEDGKADQLTHWNPGTPDAESRGSEPADGGEGREVGSDLSSGPAGGDHDGDDPRGRDVQDACGPAQVHGAGVEDAGSAEVSASKGEGA